MKSRVRFGMVGGGEGAFIGAVHRHAAQLDNEYELVCGAFSAAPEKSIPMLAAPRPIWMIPIIPIIEIIEEMTNEIFFMPIKSMLVLPRNSMNGTPLYAQFFG